MDIIGIPARGEGDRLLEDPVGPCPEFVGDEVGIDEKEIDRLSGRKAWGHVVVDENDEDVVTKETDHRIAEILHLRAFVDPEADDEDREEKGVEVVDVEMDDVGREDGEGSAVIGHHEGEEGPDDIDEHREIEKPVGLKDEGEGHRVHRGVANVEGPRGDARPDRITVDRDVAEEDPIGDAGEKRPPMSPIKRIKDEEIDDRKGEAKIDQKAVRDVEVESQREDPRIGPEEVLPQIGAEIAQQKEEEANIEPVPLLL